MKSILFLFIVGFGAIGCNKPLPNPEIKDPIYMDLANSISAMATVASEKEKMLETSFAELEKRSV